jgi:Zn-finger nucleic acid-binding protein
MKCPVDDTTLAISDRHGIEIDYCPSCRGVWLDRGELEKVIERETRWVEDSIADRDKSDRDKPTARPAEKPKKKKVTSFLQDLMEFGQQ